MSSPIVVLFSTHYRTWDVAADCHIEVLRKLTNDDLSRCVIGIHVWDGDGVPQHPPERIRQLSYIMTRTKQTKHDDDLGILLYINESTKLALNNAEELYVMRYKSDMPDDQVIVRLRPDSYVDDIDNTIHTYALHETHGSYTSIWNLNHRGSNEKAPEIADTMYYTTKGVLRRLFDVPIEELKSYFNQKRQEGYEICFHEQFLYHALQYVNTCIVFDFKLKLGLMRQHGHVEKLTYQ